MNNREVALNKAKSYIIESIQVLAETIKKGDFYEKLPTDQQYELVRKRIRDIVSTGIECAPIRVIAKELGLDNSIQGMSWLQSIINELLYYGVIAEIKPECYYIVED